MFYLSLGQIDPKIRPRWQCQRICQELLLVQKTSQTLTGITQLPLDKPYRSPIDNSCHALFDSLSSTVKTLATEFLPGEIVVLDDFKDHDKDWLESRKTGYQGRSAELFAINNSPTNLVRLHLSPSSLSS